MIKIWACGVAVALGAWGSVAGAAEYYVSPQGIDTNAGTAAAPFLTLQKAADVALPDDTVHVADGTYAGFKPAHEGKPGYPIRFIAQGKGAIINRPGAQTETSNVWLTSFTQLDGFTVTAAPSWGVRFSSTTGAVIKNCTFTKNGVVNIYGGHTTDALIIDNEVSYAGTEHGIYVANSSTGTLIRHNHVHHNAVAGIHLNGDKSQPPGDGVIRGLTIERNTIHDNGQNGINMDGVQDTVIRNNLIYRNTLNGVRAYVIDAAEGPKGLSIINNTILVPAKSSGWCVRITEDLGGNLVRNCILLSENPATGSIALDGTKGFSSDHNLVVDRMTPDRDETILTLAAWQAKGYDTGSALSTPAALFVQPGSDFHLKPGCAAVNQGSSQDAPANDLDGNARPQGSAVDIGCYEYGASPKPGDSSTRDASIGPGGEGGLRIDQGAADGLSPESDAGAARADGATAGSSSDSGCSCSVAGASEGVASFVWLLLLAPIWRRRRHADSLRPGQDLPPGIGLRSR